MCVERFLLCGDNKMSFFSDIKSPYPAGSYMLTIKTLGQGVKYVQC